MGKVEMMDVMTTLVGIVVLKVEFELQCFIYDGMLPMLIHCLEMMCFLLIDYVGKIGDIVFLPY